MNQNREKLPFQLVVLTKPADSWFVQFLTDPRW